MTDSARDTHDILATDETAAKRPWHAPALEEVDYGDTQFTANPSMAYDGTTYSS